MMFQWYSADGAAVHPLLVVMLALAMDVALGDPPRLWERIPHPVAVFGGLISFFEHKLNRPQRSDRARFWRGLLATAFLVVLAGLAGYAVQWLCAQIDYGWVAGALIASVLIAYRSLFNHVRAVADELDISLAEGRAAVGHIVGRDPDSLDENGSPALQSNPRRRIFPTEWSHRLSGSPCWGCPGCSPTRQLTHWTA